MADLFSFVELTDFSCLLANGKLLICVIQSSMTTIHVQEKLEQDPSVPNSALCFVWTSSKNYALKMAKTKL